MGFGIFAAGVTLYVVRVGLSTHRFITCLSGTLVVGPASEPSRPLLSASAVSTLRPEGFATGRSVIQTARQAGGSIGVALLPVTLGTTQQTPDTLTNFRHLRIFIAFMALVASAACVALFLRTVRNRERFSPIDEDALGVRTIDEVLTGEIAVSE